MKPPFFKYTSKPFARSSPTFVGTPTPFGFTPEATAERKLKGQDVDQVLFEFLVVCQPELRSPAALERIREVVRGFGTQRNERRRIPILVDVRGVRAVGVERSRRNGDVVEVGP